MLETLITEASRKLYLAVKPYLGKTWMMRDEDWSEVVVTINRIAADCDGTLIYEYARDYGLLLLRELEREAKRERRKGGAA